MIRFIVGFVGFLIVFGSVGELDYNPSADVLTQTLLAFGGLLLMYAAIRGIKE